MSGLSPTNPRSPGSGSINGPSSLAIPRSPLGQRTAFTQTTVRRVPGSSPRGHESVPGTSEEKKPSTEETRISVPSYLQYGTVGSDDEKGGGNPSPSCGFEALPGGPTEKIPERFSKPSLTQRCLPCAHPGLPVGLISFLIPAIVISSLEGASISAVTGMADIIISRGISPSLSFVASVVPAVIALAAAYQITNVTPRDLSPIENWGPSRGRSPGCFERLFQRVKNSRPDQWMMGVAFLAIVGGYMALGLGVDASSSTREQKDHESVVRWMVGSLFALNLYVAASLSWATSHFWLRKEERAKVVTGNLQAASGGEGKAPSVVHVGARTSGLITDEMKKVLDPSAAGITQLQNLARGDAARQPPKAPEAPKAPKAPEAAKAQKPEEPVVVPNPMRRLAVDPALIFATAGGPDPKKRDSVSSSHQDGESPDDLSRASSSSSP